MQTRSQSKSRQPAEVQKSIRKSPIKKKEVAPRRSERFAQRDKTPPLAIGSESLRARRPRAVESTPRKQRVAPKRSIAERNDVISNSSEAEDDSDELFSYSSSSSPNKSPGRSPRKVLRSAPIRNRSPSCSPSCSPSRSPRKSPSKSPKSPKIRSPRRTNHPTMAQDIQYDIGKTVNAIKQLNFDEEATDENLAPTLTLHEARSRLWRDEAVGGLLLYREAELSKIKNFIRDFVNEDGETRSMFLTGVPGIGKTSCVLQAVQQLKNEDFDDFNFINLNGGQMIKPDELYIHFLNQLEKQKGRISITRARRKLNIILSRRDQQRLPIVLLVDELDFLLTKTQSVIYDIYEWANSPNARVAIIGISNTVDLATRTMVPKIQSRMGTNTIQFQPYDHNQLQKIIEVRLHSLGDLVHNDAIRFTSCKVANTTGDVRKAMDILRMSIDLAIESNSPRLLIEHVVKADREARNEYKLHLFRSFSDTQRALFRAVYHEVAAAEELGTTFGRAFRMYQKICADSRIPSVDVYGAIEMAKAGTRLGFYVISDPPGTFNRKIALGFEAYQAKFILENVEKPEQT
ncbi:Origin recognition complex subunit 1 [Aphelenchoides besseyi]|nr:Origin recognition complex subunit 1 [Aphelenchoides besseyi]KAI6218788.1 Origin recognition complex subunit 1 [Aphelenchoides besseyi]